VLSYLQHVAERFDLKRDIQLETRVTAATCDEETERWEVRTDTGAVVSTRFLIAAFGALLAANLPDTPGLENFPGDRDDTADWPHEGVDFTGKRVGLIGTGATGIQVATEIAERADQFTLFQRTPNHAGPLGNHPLDAEFQRWFKENYDELWEQVRRNFWGHGYEPIGKRLQEATPEERERAFQERYDRGVGCHDLISASHRYGAGEYCPAPAINLLGTRPGGLGRGTTRCIRESRSGRRLCPGQRRR
jgi:cation diffusion facilitator CzcD-associated flavoprotein CzcO